MARAYPTFAWAAFAGRAAGVSSLFEKGGRIVTGGEKGGAVAEERVTRVEHQLAVAQQITHIGSWEWTLATNAVSWSDELYRIYGFEPQSCPITFEFFLGRLHPDDRERVRRAVGEALERGDRFAYPERIVRPSGEVRELDTVGEVVKSADGQVVGLIGTCRDVTDERRRDQEIRRYADIVRNVQIGLTMWDVHGGEGAAARLLAFNPEAERLAKMPLEPMLGKPFAEILPYAEGGELERLLGDVAREGGVREAKVERSRDPRSPTRAVALKAFPLSGSCVGVAIEDITAETVARRAQEAEARLLEMVAAGAPLKEVLLCLALAIEAQSPPTVAAVMLLDARGERIRHGAAPSLPEEYVRAIDGAKIGPAAGSCGTAAATKKAVFVEDIDTDPLWKDYRDLALRSGLRACWSTPILAHDERVLGTFAVYYDHPRSPSPQDLALIARATHIARIAIERSQMEDQLRALSAHVESIRENERTSIAREIHDELGQALTAIKMDLAWILRRLGDSGEPPRAALKERIAQTTELTDEVINAVRRISAELRPGVLDDLGLLAALEWAAQQFEERTGTACDLQGDLAGAELDRTISTAVFRIFQEALTNVTRHAQATTVEVKLQKEGESLVLEVKDDGVGIARNAVTHPSSLGLLGMRERARGLGGEVVIGPAEPRGTVVFVRVPIAGPDHAQEAR